MVKEEISRIAGEYRRRDREASRQDWAANIYHPRHPLGTLFHEHNYHVLVKALNCLKIDLEELKVLDFGCGHGAWLRRLVELGARPENLTGVDLSGERIRAARRTNPAINWVHSEEETLPFPSEHFDIVMQVVVFSSILDDDFSKLAAAEMSRVLKPGGYVFWVDRKEPLAGRLSGFSRGRVLGLFPGASLAYAEGVHPRYFRRLYKRHGWLCRLLYGCTRLGCEAWFFILRKGE